MARKFENSCIIFYVGRQKISRVLGKKYKKPVSKETITPNTTQLTVPSVANHMNEILNHANTPSLQCTQRLKTKVKTFCDVQRQSV